MENINTYIISGFPGIGKTYCFNSEFKKSLIMLDSDSSKFSWTKDKERHPMFPCNYIQHIKSNIGKVHFIFVSTHKLVRAALEFHGVKYNLIYPTILSKDIYLQRFKSRGDNQQFIQLVSDNWVEWIEELNREEYPKIFQLNGDKCMIDIISEILSRGVKA